MLLLVVVVVVGGLLLLPSGWVWGWGSPHIHHAVPQERVPLHQCRGAVGVGAELCRRGPGRGGGVKEGSDHPHQLRGATQGWVQGWQATLP